MTTEYNDEDDPFQRPYQPNIEGEVDLEDDEDDDDDIETVDLEEAAAEFRMRYYGPDNNPHPPAAMLELAPDVMGLVDAVVYGEIYNRPAVDLRTRSLCTISALVVLGHSPQMIKRHITGALNIGITEEEISEIISQMIFYGGMPAAVNAFRIAKETFDEQAARQSEGGSQPERSPRDTPSGYAPPYRRENVGNYGPQDLQEEELPRVRPRVGPGQESRGIRRVRGGANSRGIRGHRSGNGHHKGVRTKADRNRTGLRRAADHNVTGRNKAGLRRAADHNVTGRNKTGHSRTGESRMKLGSSEPAIWAIRWPPI